MRRAASNGVISHRPPPLFGLDETVRVPRRGVGAEVLSFEVELAEGRQDLVACVDGEAFDGWGAERG